MILFFITFFPLLVWAIAAILILPITTIKPIDISKAIRNHDILRHILSEPDTKKTISTRRLKECPSCRETIKGNASKCPFCGETIGTYRDFPLKSLHPKANLKWLYIVIAAFLERISLGLKNIALFEILDILPRVSVIFFLAFWYQTRADSQKQQQIQAWPSVLVGKQIGGGASVIEALETLNCTNPDVSTWPCTKVSLDSLILENISLKDARLSNTILNNAVLTHSNLHRAQLQDSYLEGAILNYAILTNTNLRHAHLSRADLTYAHFQDADLIDADLSGADLSGADLSGAYLIHADLSNANLTDTNLKGAYLIGANLIQAHLNRTHLENANLIAADLRETNLNTTCLDQTIYNNDTKNNAATKWPYNFNPDKAEMPFCSQQ